MRLPSCVRPASSSAPRARCCPQPTSSTLIPFPDRSPTLCSSLSRLFPGSSPAPGAARVASVFPSCHARSLPTGCSGVPVLPAFGALGAPRALLPQGSVPKPLRLLLGALRAPPAFALAAARTPRDGRSLFPPCVFTQPVAHFSPGPLRRAPGRSVPVTPCSLPCCPLGFASPPLRASPRGLLLSCRLQVLRTAPAPVCCCAVPAPFPLFLRNSQQVLALCRSLPTLQAAPILAALPWGVSQAVACAVSSHWLSPPWLLGPLLRALPGDALPYLSENFPGPRQQGLAKAPSCPGAALRWILHPPSSAPLLSPLLRGRWGRAVAVFSFSLVDLLRQTLPRVLYSVWLFYEPLLPVTCTVRNPAVLDGVFLGGGWPFSCARVVCFWGAGALRGRDGPDS